MLGSCSSSPEPLAKRRRWSSSCRGVPPSPPATNMNANNGRAQVLCYVAGDRFSLDFGFTVRPAAHHALASYEPTAAKQRWR